MDQESDGSELDEVAVAAPLRQNGVDMKVVHYDRHTAEGQSIQDKYVKNDATELDAVVLNDEKYTKYLPLKVSGAQFPIPDVDEIKGRNITSVVVLAPIDYDYTTNGNARIEREIPNQVRVNASAALDVLIKNPTTVNFQNWLEREKEISNDKQSVVLLVTG